MDEKKWWENLPNKEKKNLYKEKILNFKNFKFSKKNWIKELNTLRRWKEIIKNQSPNLYQEIIKREIEVCRNTTSVNFKN